MALLKSFSNIVGRENSPMPASFTLLKLNENELGIARAPSPTNELFLMKSLLLAIVNFIRLIEST
jgi:hypothetical protein